MCRTVRDAAILLGMLTGVDSDDAATAASAGKSQTDYAQYCDPNGLKGAHIGVARKYFGFNDAVDALMERALGVMKAQGATLVDPADVATLGRFDETELLVFMYELKADLNAYLARLGPGAPVRTLQDIIDFNERNRQKEMPYFGQDLFLKAQTKGPLTDKEYVDALAQNHQLARTEGVLLAGRLARHTIERVTVAEGGTAHRADHRVLQINTDVGEGGAGGGSRRVFRVSRAQRET